MSFDSEKLGNKISQCETAEHGLPKPSLRSCILAIGYFLAASYRGPVAVLEHSGILLASHVNVDQVLIMLEKCQLGKQSKGMNPKVPN